MKRALLDISHEKLYTGDMGALHPTTWFEGVPNDTVRMATNYLVRTQPLLAPLMHRVRCSTYHFFVPMRLIWADFEDFRTGGPSGTDATVHPFVTVPGGGFAVGSLADYLGLATGVGAAQTVSALPFRAYQMIWNFYFRDKDLQTEAVVNTGNGSDATTDLTLKNACWEKDYFTSASPSPQLGSAVTIPLTGNAAVDGIGFSGTVNQGGFTIRQSDGTDVVLGANEGTAASSANQVIIRNTNTGSGATTRPAIFADLSSVSAVDIEDLRLASAQQRFKEMMMNIGHTLPEFYRAFGVRPSDDRFQWPELLGSGHSIIQFSEVLQTAEGTDPVGDLKGHGIAAGRSNRFKYHVTEDGIFMTLSTVRPQTMYMQSVHRSWFRSSKYDYFLPQLQHLGQQPVYNKEVHLGHTSPAGTFGYQDMYSEYRHIPNTVAGEYRSTLNFWHMARDLANTAALNSDFVKCTPTDRVYAVSADQLQVRAMHKVKKKTLVGRRAKPRLL